MHIEPIDPRDPDLDTADALAEVATASETGVGLSFAPTTGPGLLTSRQLEATLLAWVTDLRPELATIDTWDHASNHHVIAINERLGCTKVATYQGLRADL